MKTKLEKEKGLEQPKEMLPPTSHRRRPPEKTKNSPEIAYTAGDRRETKRSKGNEVGEENNQKNQQQQQKNGRTLPSCRRPPPFTAVRARRPPLLRREENEGSEDDGEVDDGEAREGRKKNEIKHEEGEGFGDDGDGERPNVCVCGFDLGKMEVIRKEGVSAECKEGKRRKGVFGQVK